jgi:hypothetical protein
VSVGLSKEDQTTVSFRRRESLPVSSREAEETPFPAVPESQTVLPEPLTRRRAPEGRNWREAAESTGVEPAVQMGTPPE